MSLDACTLSNASIPSIKIVLSIGSILLSSLLFVLSQKINRTVTIKFALIYSHIITLIFPLVLLTTHSACGAFCFSCYNNPINLIGIALPTTLILSTITGFIVIPLLFTFKNKEIEIKSNWMNSFLKLYSKKLKIKIPKLYATNTAKPKAFSLKGYKTAVFLSIGLLEILNKKEIEAVLIHELAHIKNATSNLKVITNIFKIFSPFSMLYSFNEDLNKEEKRADSLVIKYQKTSKHLINAKRKLNKYWKIR